jgi:surface protein
LEYVNFSNFVFPRYVSIAKLFNDESNVPIFQGCHKLTTINLSNVDTSNVTNMLGMFYNCSSLKSLILSSFYVSNATNTSSMFHGCSSLTDLNLRNIDFTTVSEYNDMFSSITSGINIIVKDAYAQTFTCFFSYVQKLVNIC